MAAYTNIKEATKRLQNIAGTTPDGIWGIKTANALLALLDKDVVTEPEVSYSSLQDKYPEPIRSLYTKLNSVINVFETGSEKGNYSDVTIYKDGGGGSYKQITYGRAGCTQDHNLQPLLDDYLKSFGAESQMDSYSKYIYKRINGIIDLSKDRKLVDDKEFIKALEEVGKYEAMQRAQDAFFDKAYFNKAYTWFKDNGFTLPLSLLVIFDSYIHSGGILGFLRNRFSEVPPIKGGDEKKWINQYIQVRKDWLANHSNSILRKTVYRMNTFQDAIKKGNWDLSQPINANGKIIK